MWMYQGKTLQTSSIAPCLFVKIKRHTLTKTGKSNVFNNIYNVGTVCSIITVTLKQWPSQFKTAVDGL